MSASLTGFAAYTQPRPAESTHELRLPERLPPGLAVPLIGLFSLSLWSGVVALLRALV